MPKQHRVASKVLNANADKYLVLLVMWIENAHFGYKE